MEKQEDTSFWLKFFKEAGIPSKTGASYAHIFVENRIHKNMLSDLTVDYLRLMGITVMGDIIAVLRQSKSVHQDSLRKVVILKSKEDPIDKRSSSSSSSSDSSSSDDDVRMVKVTKPAPKKPLSSISSSKSSNVKSEYSQPSDTKLVKSKVIGKQTSTKTSPPSRASVIEKKTSPEPLKRKRDVPMDVDPSPAVKSTPSNTVGSGKSILKSLNAATKKIRITAENNIIGPKLPPPKKTVFDRLGSETSSPQVSSTTMEVVKPAEVVETKFTRIISNMPPPNSMDTNSSKVSSVFARLGGVGESSPLHKPTSSLLKYAGVLKSPTAVRKTPVKVIKKVGTMRADEAEIPVKLRAKPFNKSLKTGLTESLARKKFIVQHRLNMSKPTQARGRLATSPSEGIFSNPYKSKSTTSVKQRLGSSEGRAESRSANPRVRRPLLAGLQRRTSNIGVFPDDDDDEPYTFSSRVEMKDSKKVSFGKVEQKLFPAVGPMYSTREARSKISVYSRLGSGRRY